jgi:hypothetical protein
MLVLIGKVTGREAEEFRVFWAAKCMVQDRTVLQCIIKDDFM